MDLPKKRAKKYKSYLREDDPMHHVPKTTKWRMKKRTVIAPEEGFDEMLFVPDSAPTGNVTISPTDGRNNVFEPGVVDMDNENSPSDSLDVSQKVEDGDPSEVWYDTETGDWYRNEESVWFDALELNNDDEVVDNADTTQDENPHEDVTTEDGPIYTGAQITVAQSAVLILTFALRHNLTGECLSDLLTLISLHCAAANVLHLSLYRFRSFFSSLKAPLVFHKFCVKCEFLVGERGTNQCSVCKSDMNDKKNLSYFVEIPLLFQIQQLFNRVNFHQDLLHRFSRSKKSQDNIEDIYDGELYKRYSRPGCFLSTPNNISLMWYTDGVPLFKSSKISIWPLFLSINELPIAERFKQDNMLFAGLWFGRSKPSMSSFLKPFHDSLNKFRDIGFEVECMHCKSLVIIKGMLLCGTCDLPAKCMVLNMNQFNGQYGCAKCKQEGCVIASGKGHTRVFPFDMTQIDKPKRNHAEFIKHGDQAFTSLKPVVGVKGPSWWANCCPDVINGTAIDYMHCVLLGIVRRLLKLWFDSKFSSQSFSISNLVDVADRRLAEIRPPYFIKRHPRDIKEQSSYWKASECRAWLFFYSVPVLFGLLKSCLFQHYLLLVEAVYILNLESISKNDLKHCEELLIEFAGMFSVYYGDQHMSANLHQMLHLHDTVKQLGPLWVYACFSFESLNGKLVDLFHGTQNPVVQIANAVSSMLKLPALSNKVPDGTPAGDFYKKLTMRNCNYKIAETISDHAYVIGRKHLTQLEMKYITVLSRYVNFAIGDCYMFYRVLLHGNLYHCLKYNTYSRNSCTVVYQLNGTNHCGQIMFFVKVYPICHCQVNDCKCLSVFVAFLRSIVTDDQCAFLQDRHDMVYAKLAHIHTGKLVNEYVAVPVENIIGLGVAINFAGDKVCVTLRPNSVESD